MIATPRNKEQTFQIMTFYPNVYQEDRPGVQSNKKLILSAGLLVNHHDDG
jgi:hypothetical protein